MSVQVRGSYKEAHEAFIAFAAEADNLYRALGSFGEPSQPLTNQALGTALAELHSKGLQLAQEVLAPGSHALRLAHSLRAQVTESILCHFGERLDETNRVPRGTGRRTSVETQQRITGRPDLRSPSLKAQECLSRIIEIAHEIIAEIEADPDFASAPLGGDTPARTAAAATTPQMTSPTAIHAEARKDAESSSGEPSATAALEAAVDEMKNLMIAIATRERDLHDKSTENDYVRLRKDLIRYDKILAPPDFVLKCTDAWSFWREVSKDRGTYDARRAFIEESFTRHYADRLIAGQHDDLGTYLRARDIELGEQIGGGGFGDVFRAEHSVLGPRAVKVFRPHFYDGNREALQRFNREAKLLARLAHPRIVRFFDAGLAPGPRPFIITELVDGESLELQLRHRSTLETSEALDVCAQVLDALSAAHASRIIHRDIKPSNVMWSNNLATVLDLGSGGVMSDVITTRITDNPQGTIGYMAPELMDDPTLLDPRTDVYSVGVMLHRLITGRALQPGDLGHYLMQKPASQGLIDVLRRATAPAAERYQTAAEMASALHEVRTPAS